MRGGIIVVAKHSEERLAQKGVFIAIIPKAIDRELFKLSCMFIDNYIIAPQTDIRVAPSTLFQLGNKSKNGKKTLVCNVNTRDHSEKTFFRLKRAFSYLGDGNIFPMEALNKRPFVRIPLF